MQSPFKAQSMHLSQSLQYCYCWLLLVRIKMFWGGRVTGCWHAFKLFIIISRISSAFLNHFFLNGFFNVRHAWLLNLSLETFVSGIVKGDRETSLFRVCKPLPCSVKNGWVYSYWSLLSHPVHENNPGLMSFDKGGQSVMCDAIKKPQALVVRRSAVPQKSSVGAGLPPYLCPSISACAWHGC